MALRCALKLFQFLDCIAQQSKKYQIFFDKKEKDLEEKFAEFGFKLEDI